MSENLELKAHSEFLRRQIKNISMCMQTIIDKTILNPLQSMVIFNRIQLHFTKTENEAYLSCSDMDKAQSIEAESNTVKSTYDLINVLTELKNEAKKLVGNESQSNELLTRFHKQLDTVEQLMNLSISPLIYSTALSEKGKRQALETLERWAELYRHGLKASGNVTENGEEWLKEAHQRLDLTADALRRLDVLNEAIATKNREHKSAS